MTAPELFSRCPATTDWWCREARDLGYDTTPCTCTLHAGHEGQHRCCCGTRWGPGGRSLTTDERAERDRILDALATGDRAPLLAYLRRELRRRYPGRWVTADHARRIMEEEGIEAGSNNFLGALFRGDPEWYTDGARVASETPGSHANQLLRWRAWPRG